MLSANANIASAFGASPTFLNDGELGGGYSTGGIKSQTATATMNETVNLALLPSRQDLVVGFFDGTALAGTGVTKITFDLYVNGVDEDAQSWTGAGAAAAATTYFTDNAVDLGSLASGGALTGTSSTLTLKAVMTVTSTTANSGFYGGVGHRRPAGGEAENQDAFGPAVRQRRRGLRSGRRNHGRGVRKPSRRQRPADPPVASRRRSGLRRRAPLPIGPPGAL